MIFFHPRMSLLPSKRPHILKGGDGADIYNRNIIDSQRNKHDYDGNQYRDTIASIIATKATLIVHLIFSKISSGERMAKCNGGF